MTSPGLTVDAAQRSIAGRKAVNEDCAGVFVPNDAHYLNHKGITLVVADGVSSAEAGKEASETAVNRFIEEYYHTPDTWSVSHAGEKIVTTLNLRLYRKSHEFITEGKGYLTTFSSLILKSQTAHFFHVGDSRIYHLTTSASGEQTPKQVTQDHTAFIERNHAILSRAVGMDSKLNIDYGSQSIHEGDIFLLTSDGVHDFVDNSDLQTILRGDESSAEKCQRIVELAHKNGSDDNISAAVVKITALPEESLDDYSAKLTRLPFPPELNPGMAIDGYRIENTLFASARSQLYLVRDEANNNTYVMKTPSRNYEDDWSYIDRFIQEEWIGLRINNAHVVRVIQADRKKTYLYYLMEYIEGIGLDQWITQHQPPEPKRAIALVKQIAQGLSAFHDNEAIHQDLRPANILITHGENNEEKAVIVDFGSVYVAGLAELQRPLVHDGALGTASYSDPMYLMGKNPGIRGDVYALATITYEMFTGHLPYGNAVEECRTAFDYDRLRYHSASSYNPIIPQWFDGALEKGVTFNLETRYASIRSLLKDLTQPNPVFLKEDPVTEKSASTLLFWKLLSGFWFFTFLLLIYLFSQTR